MRCGCSRRRISAGTRRPSSPRSARKGTPARDVDELVDRARRQSARPGDQVLIMSNGGFGGLHGKLLEPSWNANQPG